MGLSEVFRRVEAKSESRNGTGAIIDNETDRAAMLGRALVELIVLVVAEVKAREDSPQSGNVALTTQVITNETAAADEKGSEQTDIKKTER
jgi:hypothetical protein